LFVVRGHWFYNCCRCHAHVHVCMRMYAIARLCHAQGCSCSFGGASWLTF
jgi:hypothetical protein